MYKVFQKKSTSFCNLITWLILVQTTSNFYTMCKKLKISCSNVFSFLVNDISTPEEKKANNKRMDMTSQVQILDLTVCSFLHTNDAFL